MTIGAAFRLALAGGAALLIAAACGGGEEAPSGSPAPTATAATPAVTATASPSPSPTPLPASQTASPAPQTPAPAVQPTGFPIAPNTRLGVVTGAAGSRILEFRDGPTAESYARLDQPSDDPERANRSGWNCRVHYEYEAIAAVDFYVAVDTPIVATMDGTATLYAISATNSFDYYGVSREPYLGNPDRSRAPLSPFPGPGAGKGVFVRVQNPEFTTEDAHLDLTATASALADGAFYPGSARDTDYSSRFGPLRGYLDAVPIARWQVSRGDVIGYSGDAGYSEGPHLHYTVQRGTGPLLCPTAEAGFDDGGWLLK